VICAFVAHQDIGVAESGVKLGISNKGFIHRPATIQDND
jgi:hypothetical protein